MSCESHSRMRWFIAMHIIYGKAKARKIVNNT
jgi:hypothetical protein